MCMYILKVFLTVDPVSHQKEILKSSKQELCRQCDILTLPCGKLGTIINILNNYKN